VHGGAAGRIRRLAAGRRGAAGDLDLERDRGAPQTVMPIAERHDLDDAIAASVTTRGRPGWHPCGP
jgi:hypothetical protein